MKSCSIICVIGYAAFWVFGYLALTTDPSSVGSMLLATVIAGAGFLAGTLSYLKISRELC
ncbi:MAG: hypothetical protein ACNA7Q_03015 [Rhodobacterales bacterium]